MSGQAGLLVRLALIVISAAGLILLAFWLLRAFLARPARKPDLREPSAPPHTAVWPPRSARPLPKWTGNSSDFQVELMAAQLLERRPGLSPEVICDGRLLVASLQSKDGPEIFVVADPDLLNNHGLARGDNAGLVHALLTHRLGARGAVFDETIHGFRRTPGLLAEALRFPLLTATLQAVVLVGMLLWAGMGRFGKPLQPPAALGDGRQVLIDSTARLLTWGGHAGESLRATSSTPRTRPTSPSASPRSPSA